MQVKKEKLDKLALFTFLWTVASLFHLMAFFKYLLDNPLAWATGAAAVLLLFRLRSVVLFVMMLFFSVIKTFIWLPSTPNHILFELVINVGILIAFGQTILASKTAKGFSNTLNNADRERFYRSFAPMARAGLIILYMFAAIAKLNRDFLDPVISCGTWWLNVIRNNGLMFIPDNLFTRNAAIYGTVLIEAGIPLLLIFSKTRWWGIVLGIAFHLFLSLDPHVGMLSFCTLLFALFFLFTPPDFPEKLDSVYQKFREGQERVTRFVYGLVAIGLALVIVVLTIARYDDPLKYFPFSAWYLYATVLVVIMLTVRYGEKWQDQTGNRFFAVSGLLPVIPVILLINGLSPYIGLKTQTSFSMYSNLRTEGGISNHLFIPRLFQVTNRADDLVEILATDNKRLTKIDGMNIVAGQHLITYFEFQRIVSSTRKDFYVKYLRNGQLQYLQVKNGISSDPKITTPHHWLIAKLVQYRPIDKGPCNCKH